MPVSNVALVPLCILCHNGPGVIYTVHESSKTKRQTGTYNVIQWPAVRQAA